MAHVSLAKALKTKNRITSRITNVRKQMLSHNAFMVSKEIPYDEIALQVNVRSLNNELTKLTEALVHVKASINKGNHDSAEMIFALSETKGLISFYESLDCNENERNYYPNSNDVKRVQIKIAERNDLVRTLVKKAEELQDKLDEFNATQRVFINDDVLSL